MKELINWHLKRDLINKYRKNNIHVSDKMDTILNDLIDKLLDQKLVEIPPFKKEELEVLRCRYFIQNRTYQAIEAISNNLQRKEYLNDLVSKFISFLK